MESKRGEEGAGDHKHSTYYKSEKHSKKAGDDNEGLVSDIAGRKGASTSTTDRAETKSGSSTPTLLVEAKLEAEVDSEFEAMMRPASKSSSHRGSRVPHQPASITDEEAQKILSGFKMYLF